jgi:hypothetical protein
VFDVKVADFMFRGFVFPGLQFSPQGFKFNGVVIAGLTSNLPSVNICGDFEANVKIPFPSIKLGSTAFPSGTATIGCNSPVGLELNVEKPVKMAASFEFDEYPAFCCCVACCCFVQVVRLAVVFFCCVCFVVCLAACLIVSVIVRFVLFLWYIF